MAAFEENSAINLLEGLHQAGASDVIAPILKQDPAAHVGLDETRYAADLMQRLREANARHAFTTVAARAATEASLDHAHDATRLLPSGRGKSDRRQRPLFDRARNVGMSAIFLDEYGEMPREAANRADALAVVGLASPLRGQAPVSKAELVGTDGIKQ